MMAAHHLDKAHLSLLRRTNPFVQIRDTANYSAVLDI